MIKVSKQAKEVLDVLTAGLESPGDHRKIDNSPGSFMAVHVEHIGTCDLGPIYSIAHYYQQMGDLMKDPDTTFLKDADCNFYPLEFQQDNPPIYQRCIEWEDGKIKNYNPKLQKDMADFTAMWMRNIREQQGL